MEKKIKCAVYICDYCGFEDPGPVDDLKKHSGFKEADLSTYPKFECHGCHTHLITVKKLEYMPASWFPDITPEEFFKEPW